MTPDPAEPVFRAIADPTRRRILGMLAAGEQPAGALQAPFAMSQPAFSQHLRVLREAGLVTERRVGRRRLYRVTPEPLGLVTDWVGKLRTFWRERLLALSDLLDQAPP